MPTFQISSTTPTETPKTTSVADQLKSTNVMVNNDGKILTSTSPMLPVKARFNNSFVSSAFLAYSNHHNLVLRPDDVWLALMITFANFIDSHAEEMRPLFVQHEGKKQLEVKSNGNLQSANWSALIGAMSTLIDMNTHSNVRAWMEPSFTTTTPKDSLIGRVLLMGAMKNYFDCKFSMCCGLPSITLEGTLEDWKNIRQRADKLLEYGKGTSAWATDLVRWHKILVPVLDKFISTYSASQADVDEDFWNQICNHVSGGSGPSYISGWINVFIPFQKGKYALDKETWFGTTYPWGAVDTGDVPCGAVEIPVTIDDNGKEYKTIFYAGAIVSSYNVDTNNLAPSFDWVLIDISNSQDAERQVVREKLQKLREEIYAEKDDVKRKALRLESHAISSDAHKKWPEHDFY